MWSVLRSRHRDALRRQRKLIASGATACKMWIFQEEMEFLLPYMAKRKRGDHLQHSDDEESQPQSDNTDSIASHNLEISNVESVTKENDDVNSENNDSNEDMDMVEDTAEPVQSTLSFVKNQISKQPPKKMKKHDVARRIQRSIEQREQGTKERAIEHKNLEDSKYTNDPLYNFFLSMYQTTQKMPPAYQHFVRTKIYEVVSQTEASLLNIPQPLL